MSAPESGNGSASRGVIASRGARVPLQPAGHHMLDVPDIMRRVRVEIARKHSAKSPPGRARPEARTEWQPVAARLPDQESYALGDFLRFTDEDFIDVVYRKVLRRPAADAGSRDYLRALREGRIDKVDVLGSIRFSDEGRRHNVPIAGLSRRYRLRRWEHARGVGWLIRLMVAVLHLSRLENRLYGMEASAASESQAIGRFLNQYAVANARGRAELADAVAGLTAVRAAAEARITGKLRAHDAILRQNAAELTAHLVTLRQNAAELNTHGAALDQTAAALKAHEATMSEHAALLAELHGPVQEDQRRLRAMLERLTVFLDVTARNRSENALVATEARAAPAKHYASFEDAFRGDPADIQLRVAHYLGTLKEAGLQPGSDGVVLDLGSGRGEWLDVLAERGYRGRGVDTDAGMLERAIARGHDVVQASALDYLRTQDANTFIAVTSMHMVEHIPHVALLQLLDEALRVLRPGGLLILETPNPENVLVGTWRFYMDPTHLHPIPPLLLQWTVQACGFQQVAIDRLSDHRGEPELTPVPSDVPGAQQINQMVAWFTAPPDYAVIARKPGQPI